jgi:ATP-binding cassette subfamily C protein LapB
MNEPLVEAHEAGAAPKPKPSRPISIQLAPSQVAFTPPLIECLAIASRLHGKPVTVTALESGLPRTQEGLTPYACIRAARREGIDARIVHKPSIKESWP